MHAVFNSDQNAFLPTSEVMDYTTNDDELPNVFSAFDDLELITPTEILKSFSMTSVGMKRVV